MQQSAQVITFRCLWKIRNNYFYQDKLNLKVAHLILIDNMYSKETVMIPNQKQAIYTRYRAVIVIKPMSDKHLFNVRLNYLNITQLCDENLNTLL